jgi:hypothetical protein
MGVRGFATAVDFSNKMPTKLLCYFGHSCLLFLSHPVLKLKKGSLCAIGS